jgi:hypothetical protein
MRIAKRTATRIAILAVSASHASRLSGWSGARTSEPRSADTVEAVHQFRESGRPSARIERQQNSFIRLRDNRYRLDLAQRDSFAGDLVDVPDDRLRQLWFLDRFGCESAAVLEQWLKGPSSSTPPKRGCLVDL